jgi:hypothetical protein
MYMYFIKQVSLIIRGFYKRNWQANFPGMGKHGQDSTATAVLF